MLCYVVFSSEATIYMTGWLLVGKPHNSPISPRSTKNKVGVNIKRLLLTSTDLFCHITENRIGWIGFSVFNLLYIFFSVCFCYFCICIIIITIVYSVTPLYVFPMMFENVMHYKSYVYRVHQYCNYQNKENNYFL